MAKITAVIVTIIGLLLILPLLSVTFLEAYNDWLIAIGVLVIGVAKLIRNFKK